MTPIATAGAAAYGPTFVGESLGWQLVEPEPRRMSTGNVAATARISGPPPYRAPLLDDG